MIEFIKGHGIELNNDHHKNPERRWFAGIGRPVKFGRLGYRTYPVSGGSISTLEFGIGRLWWGGWRVLDWS